MRSMKEVVDEMDALYAQKPRFRLFGPPEERERVKAWELANPQAMSRIGELEAEIKAIGVELQRQNADRELRSDLHGAGLGERTIELVCGTPAQTPAMDAVQDWLKSERTWLVLTGDVGTGKTAAAGWALKVEIGRGAYAEGRVDLNDRGRPRGTGAFRRAPEVVRLSAFNEGAEELRRLKSVATLIIDDLGTEHSTSWGNSLIHEIFDARHDDKLRTIITTNIKRDALKGALGDRLADRIAQDGKVVFLEGKSMRRAPPTTEPKGVTQANPQERT